MRSENIYRMQRLLSILFSICLIQIAIAAPRMVRNVGTADGESYTKIIRDGQIIIIRDGVEYNLMGQVIK